MQPTTFYKNLKNLLTRCDRCLGWGPLDEKKSNDLEAVVLFLEDGDLETVEKREDVEIIIFSLQNKLGCVCVCVFG